jgi:hypothetical protein
MTLWLEKVSGWRSPKSEASCSAPDYSSSSSGSRLVLIASKEVGRDRLAARRHFRQCVSCFIEPSWDVVKFETVELVFQPTDLLAIRSHLGAKAAQLFHHLINNKSRVASDLKSLNAQLVGDVKAVDERFVLSHII